MSTLESILRQRIQSKGPMTVADFMTLALSHPEYGYYMTRDPFGKQGDFTTAPEISQMFGEMVGLWLVDIWMRMDMPAAFTLLECGPGRGTLMADIMRATRNVKGFHEACTITLMEISPILKAKQLNVLKQYNPQHVNSLNEVPDNKPILFVANEFLDALPVHQYVGREERKITCAHDVFSFVSDEKVTREQSPEREAFSQTLFHMMSTATGAGLFIDYGYEKGQGDTLQAVYQHDYCSPLDHIGNADITAHVDFGALMKTVPARITSQGHFLRNMGIHTRAQTLIQNGANRETINQALHRLTHHDEMGTLFKVMGMAHDKTLITSGF